MEEKKVNSITKVGEAYFRFNLEFNETNRSIVKEIVLKNIRDHEIYNKYNLIGYFIEYSSLKYSIEFEEGSLKTNIIIWATTLYMGIGNYGSFREGLREVSKDIKTISTSIIKAIEDDPATGGHSVRTENRNGLIGRISEINSKVENLERKIPDMTDSEIQNQLRTIKQDIANLSSSLPSPLKQDFLDALDSRYSQDLPEPNQKKVNYYMSRYFLKPNEKIEFIND